jgi:hypothetical protein
MELPQESNRPSSSFLRESTTTFDSPLFSHDPPFISKIPSPAGGFTSVVSYGQIHYGGCHFGHISQHNGIPMLSEEGKKWITSKTDEEFLFEPGPQDFANPATSCAPHYYNNPDDLYELPSRDTMEKIFSVFVHSSFSLVFPIVDRILFKDTIDLAYQPYAGETPSLDHLSARACVLAFASIIPLFQGSVAEMPYVDTDLCATKARYLLTDVLEGASITNIQVTFMLVSLEPYLNYWSTLILIRRTCMTSSPEGCGPLPCFMPLLVE